MIIDNERLTGTSNLEFLQGIIGIHLIFVNYVSMSTIKKEEKNSPHANGGPHVQMVNHPPINDEQNCWQTYLGAINLGEAGTLGKIWKLSY